jgi:cellulose synthase/poly-beta-1,6-N-acetylglucosamine synthase-like glycosyltransferase
MKALAVIPAYSHIDWRLLECLRKVDVPILYLHGCSDLPRARSTLLTNALESDAEAFLLIDSDMAPTPEQVDMLRSSPKLSEKAAVTGAYLTKWRFFAFQPKDRSQTFQLHGSPRFVECFAAGLGFSAVHRGSLENFRRKLPAILEKGGTSWYPFCIPRTFEDPESGGRTEYLSEDYAFWYDLGKAGTSLWLDTHIAVSHLITAPLVIQEGMHVDPRT